MPVYEYRCDICGTYRELLMQIDSDAPLCCGHYMSRIFTGSVAIRDSRSLTGKRNENWIGRFEEVNKKRADKGERYRFVHPSEIF